MRGLLISDIHANPWALRAVEQQAGVVDFILCAGDCVNYGPAPWEVIDWLRDRQAWVVQGNHDYAVVTGDDPRASSAKQPIALAMRDWTKHHLRPDHINYLASRPKTRVAEFGGTQFRIIHGTPFGPLYDYRLTPQISDAELDAMLAGMNADVLVVGHTHLPLIRQRHTVCVVNPGSVGQPLDGDPRAAYAIYEDGQIRLERAAYEQRPILDAIDHLPCLNDDQRNTLKQIIVRGKTL